MSTERVVLSRDFALRRRRVDGHVLGGLRSDGADADLRMSYELSEATRQALLEAILAPARQKAEAAGERIELKRREP